MDGEKPTNKALQFRWQSTPESANGVQPNQHRIAVIGIGKTGNNTIKHLTKMGAKDVYTLIIDTDSPSLDTRQVSKKIRDIDAIIVTTNLREPNSTRIATRVAEIAREEGIPAVEVVTKTFQEKSSAKQTSQAITKLQKKFDKVIIIDNNKLMELKSQLPLNKLNQIADQISANTIKGLIETISSPSLANLDTANFKTLVKRSGVTMIGIGESNAPNRAEEAVHNAFKNTLLNSHNKAISRALINISGDTHMTLEEVNHVGEFVKNMIESSAQVSWGTNIDPKLDGRIRVTIVMTGADTPHRPSSINSAAPQLFNLEPTSKMEKKLPIDLDLYQLENF